MKRYSNLFDQIISKENLNEAFLKALRGKRSKKAVILFCKNAVYNLETIRTSLIDGTYEIKPYNQFKIFDPKERLITAADFSDRIVHHAIMNVLEVFFEKQFVYQTFACRKNKGLHKAVKYIFKKTQHDFYYIKLDIKKYFDSIDHDVLKVKLSRLFKEKNLLLLLYKIIDSYHVFKNRGLPIGNLTSQFFANYYLSSLDHIILEQLKPVGYVRYMDDMIVICRNYQKIKSVYEQIENYCKNELKLELKTSIINTCDSGFSFLSRRIDVKHFSLTKKALVRKYKKQKQLIYDYERGVSSESECAAKLNCMWAY